jgi:hypothetical protein
MNTINLKSLVDQINRNCEISDARHAGLFSVCGLALRLRDLYKWQHRLPPWQESDPGLVLEWIGEKEERWEQVAKLECRPLQIPGGPFDVYDTEAINRVLIPHGLFYGAGYARSLKPTFFLAEISTIEKLDGIDVFYLDRELARDLLNMPALNQNDQIVLRQESARAHLWEHLVYVNRSGQTALRAALAECGLFDHRPEYLRQHLDTIWRCQRNTYIYHELAEMRDSVFEKRLWRGIIADFPHSRTELLVRAVKDLLADTGPNGTLSLLMRDGNAAALGFYAAFTEGLAKELFPQIRKAFADFLRNRNWRALSLVIREGFDTARSYAERIMAVYLDGMHNGDPAQTETLIEAMLPETVRRPSQLGHFT